MAADSRRIDEPHSLHAPHSLPAFRQLQAMIELTQKEDVPIRKLCELLESDDAAASRVMRAARSIRLGRHRPVDKLSHAISLLGLRRVQTLLKTLERTDPRFRPFIGNSGVRPVVFPHSPS